MTRTDPGFEYNLEPSSLEVRTCLLVSRGFPCVAARSASLLQASLDTPQFASAPISPHASKNKTMKYFLFLVTQ